MVDLLQSLAAETGQTLSDFNFNTIGESDKDKLLKSKNIVDGATSFEDNLHLESLPLSEEDLLKKPFYTVEQVPSVNQGNENLPQGIKFVTAPILLRQKKKNVVKFNI